MDFRFKVTPQRLLDVGRKLRIIGWSILGACALSYVAQWGRAAWHQRDARAVFEAQKNQAEELSLTYEAVLLAPDKLANKPVLWTMGRTGEQWYYRGDKQKPVRFLNPPDLAQEGHKGMDSYVVLALIRGAGPQGVFLEYLRAY